MTTRTQIIQTADELIRKKGYNAFSFFDIAPIVGIKKASIHYHFPQKSDLGVAVIDEHIHRLEHLIHGCEEKSSIEKLHAFISIYERAKAEDKLCIIGAIASDFNTVDDHMKNKLLDFTRLLSGWVSSFLEEGKRNHVFRFSGSGRDKALMIITHMLAIVQLSRVTGDQDFATVIDTIKQDLINA